jgi:DNA-binding transcriptional MocR family regulator
MLNDDGCQELNRLCDLAASHDVAVLEDDPMDEHRLVGRIM